MIEKFPKGGRRKSSKDSEVAQKAADFAAIQQAINEGKTTLPSSETEKDTTTSKEGGLIVETTETIEVEDMPAEVQAIRDKVRKETGLTGDELETAIDTELEKAGWGVEDEIIEEDNQDSNMSHQERATVAAALEKNISGDKKKENTKETSPEPQYHTLENEEYVKTLPQGIQKALKDPQTQDAYQKYLDELYLNSDEREQLFSTYADLKSPDSDLTAEAKKKLGDYPSFLFKNWQKETKEKKKTEANQITPETPPAATEPEIEIPADVQRKQEEFEKTQATDANMVIPDHVEALQKKYDEERIADTPQETIITPKKAGDTLPTPQTGESNLKAIQDELEKPFELSPELEEKAEKYKQELSAMAEAAKAKILADDPKLTEEQALKLAQESLKKEGYITPQETEASLGKAWQPEDTPTVSDPEAEKELIAAFKKAGLEQEKKIDNDVEKSEPWIKNSIEKAAGWYTKQPLRYKLLAAGGFIGAASASALVGGAVGTAMATAAFTGSIAQRTLGGMALFVATEGVLKKAVEKTGRARTKAEAIRHQALAATAGVLVGSGAVADAISNISENIADIHQLAVDKTVAGMENVAAIKNNLVETVQGWQDSLSGVESTPPPEVSAGETSLEGRSPLNITGAEQASEVRLTPDLTNERPVIEGTTEVRSLPDLTEERPPLGIEQTVRPTLDLGGGGETESSLTATGTAEAASQPYSGPPSLDAVQTQPDQTFGEFLKDPTGLGVTETQPDVEIPLRPEFTPDTTGGVPEVVPTAIEHTVVRGDNLWNIISNNLESQGSFSGMDEAQRTFLIDSVKDQFAGMSEQELKDMGISSGNIDQLRGGDTINLSSVFEKEGLITEATTAAENLSVEARGDIIANNAAIQAYAAAHPEEYITEAKIEEILNPTTQTPEILNATATAEMNTKIDEIYGKKWWHFQGGEGQGVKEWLGTPAAETADGVAITGIKDMPVSKIFEKDFGEPFGRTMDQVEANNRKELLKYLTELRASGSIPTPTETTEQYIMRAITEKGA